MEKITVAVDVQVSLADAWKLFTEPEHVMRWNNASPDWHTPRAENNLVTGGSFNYRMEAVDGTAGFDFEGVYSEVVPLESFAYMLADREVHVEFTHADGVTHIVETFDAENENPLEMQRAGWQAILDNFKRHAERLYTK